MPPAGDIQQMAVEEDEDSVGDVLFEDELQVSGATSVDPSILNIEQRRAYDIITRHMQATKAGEPVPQLLMQIIGEGGTGKSKVIQLVTETFEAEGVRGWLQKGAFTGIAASLIGGRTLHVLAQISLKGGRPGLRARRKLEAFWANVRYLIIDEISMVSCEFFEKLSSIIGEAKGGSTNTPFGGLNVIICGDFHQFPPVGGRPLFWPAEALKTTDEQTGRSIYEQFETVVLLRQQMRTADPVWRDFLRRLRHGACNRQDAEMLDALNLRSANCVSTDMAKEEWCDAELVTPRHAVRRRWNEMAVRKHCQVTGQRLFRCRALDTIAGRALSLRERFMLAEQTARRRQRSVQKTLEDVVELAVGMKVMVTLNVQTEIDLANGARGRIVDIILHPNEPDIDPEKREVTLQYPPLYVLVKLDRTKATALAGLADRVLPITPRLFRRELEVEGRKVAVKRLQLPLCAAYAFTDYRAQGQTICPVLVDLAKTPSKGLTPFNAYVACSRAAGRDWIRFIRDVDWRQFVSHPSEHLRQEDRRQAALDARTRQLWENGMLLESM